MGSNLVAYQALFLLSHNKLMRLSTHNCANCIRRCEYISLKVSVVLYNKQLPLSVDNVSGSTTTSTTFMQITCSLGWMVWWVVMRGFPAAVRFDCHLENVRHRDSAEKSQQVKGSI